MLSETLRALSTTILSEMLRDLSTTILSETLRVLSTTTRFEKKKEEHSRRTDVTSFLPVSHLLPPH